MPDVPPHVIADREYAFNQCVKLGLDNDKVKKQFEWLKNQLQSYDWELKQVVLTWNNLTNADELKHRAQNPIEAFDDEERFEKQRELASKVTEPVLLIADGSKYEVLEGRHRIIAALSTEHQFNTYAYVGVPK